MLRRVFNNEFEKTFRGTIILDGSIEDKLNIKHKVYKEDLADALTDPNRVIMRAKQKSTIPKNKLKSNGKLYEILCLTSYNRVLFIIGRLFQDGNLYIITSYWADPHLKKIYQNESEVPHEQEAQ